MTASRLLENLVGFGRVLRSVGIPCTPTQVADVARAWTWIDIGDPAAVFSTARALLVTRWEDLELFETVFSLYWRSHDIDRRPRGRTQLRAAPPSAERFTIATYATFRATKEMEERDVVDRRGSASYEEILSRKRFAEMTAEELDAARRMVARFRWQASLRVTRRRSPDGSGPEIDLRRVLRETARLGSVPAILPRRARTTKPRPVVLLADISGSMERYSRLLLHFFHTLGRLVPDLETFVFGTRLSRITPHLRLRNVDRAVDEVATQVSDWSGGTRIGACLGRFNRDWGRRVLRRGAIVLIVSDGCDRGPPDELAREMARLRGRCSRLVWLNPHAGHERYTPAVAGMRVALPYVDEFLPLQDVRSFADLSTKLARMKRTGTRRVVSTAPARGTSFLKSRSGARQARQPPGIGESQ